MNYTGEQLKLLSTFEYGRLIQELNEQELVVYRFLIGQELLQPRADIEDGWHLLSEKGKSVLEERKKQADDLSEQKSKAKKEKAADRLHDFLMILVGATVAFALDHIEDIVDAIASLFH
jgi:hypothetical protein